MFTNSPQDKKIAEIIKIIPKIWEPLVLNTVCGYLDDLRLFFLCVCVCVCDGYSWVPCLFWTVNLSTVLQKNPPYPADSSVFQHLLHIWTLSSSDCMILISIFSHWGQLRDSNTTIKKGSNIHWCSRRKHDALRAGGVKTFWIWRLR